MDADAYLMNRRRFLVASGLVATTAVTGIAWRRATTPAPGVAAIIAELQACEFVEVAPVVGDLLFVAGHGRLGEWAASVRGAMEIFLTARVRNAKLARLKHNHRPEA